MSLLSVLPLALALAEGLLPLPVPLFLGGVVVDPLLLLPVLRTIPRCGRAEGRERLVHLPQRRELTAVKPLRRGRGLPLFLGRTLLLERLHQLLLLLPRVQIPEGCCSAGRSATTIALALPLAAFALPFAALAVSLAPGPAERRAFT